MSVAEYDRFFRKASHKNLTLTFSDGTVLTNSSIVSESLSIEESLCSDDDLYYGACESSCLSIRIAYTEQSFKGLHLQVGVVADGDDTFFVTDEDDFFVTDDDDYYANAEMQAINLGNYLVVSDVPTNDRSYRDLVCYDKMYEITDLDVSTWYKGLTFPMTLKAFRDSLFSYLNVTQESTTLINDSYNIVGGFTTDELTCRDVLVSICELNGVFGHIDKATGKFQYIDLTTSESIEYPYYVNGSGAYEDYVTDKITGVIAKSAEDEVGTLVGTTTNLYTIQENLCLYGNEGKPAETTALTNLLNKIKDIQYRPFTVQTYGNPMLPLGTNVTFETTYQTVTSIVMKKYLSGIQALRDTLTATGEKVYPADEVKTTSQLKRLKGVSHKLVVDVNQLISEIYDEDTGILSTISQISDEIVLKVDSNGKIVKVALSANPSTGTEFKVSADNISFIANGKIELTSNSLEINSTYFKVDASGKITATNADITGKIQSNEGKIGGWEITNEGLEGVSVYMFSGRSGQGYYVPGYIQLYNDSSQTQYITLNGDGGIGGSYGDSSFGLGAGSALGPQLYLSEENSTVWGGQDTNSFYYSWGIVVNRYEEPNAKPDFEMWMGDGGSLNVEGDFAVSGTKSRVVKTDDYGKRLLYCYETSTPMFGDVGEGTIADDGKCYIWLESVFAQTINQYGYQVFLQKYGKGECYVTERKANYFVVEGDAGLSFGWEIKAKQNDYEMVRLSNNFKGTIPRVDYGRYGTEHIDEIKKEREESVA